MCWINLNIYLEIQKISCILFGFPPLLCLLVCSNGSFSFIVLEEKKKKILTGNENGWWIQSFFNISHLRYCDVSSVCNVQGVWCSCRERKKESKFFLLFLLIIFCFRFRFFFLFFFWWNNTMISVFCLPFNFRWIFLSDSPFQFRPMRFICAISLHCHSYSVLSFIHLINENNSICLHRLLIHNFQMTEKDLFVVCFYVLSTLL